MSSGKAIASPFLTGAGGTHFEEDVQTSFVVLMLARGIIPCLPGMLVEKIKFQTQHAGFKTDDLVVFAQAAIGSKQQKMLCQMKHSIGINKTAKFKEVIKAAWDDFNNSNLFERNQDVIALITGPLSIADMNVRTILEWAREMESAEEFLKNVEKAKFSSKTKRDKLKVFQEAVNSANNNQKVSDEEFVEFLKHFHLIGYDLDIKTGVNIALLHSLIGQYAPHDVQNIWSRLLCEVRTKNQNAGTLDKNSFPDDLLKAFRKPGVEIIPSEFVKPKEPMEGILRISGEEQALVIAMLLGGWDDKNEDDLAILRRFVNGF
jgi:hypothetical protein